MPPWTVDERLEQLLGTVAPGDAHVEAGWVMPRARTPGTFESRPWTAADFEDDVVWMVVFLGRYGNQPETALEGLTLSELRRRHAIVMELLQAELKGNRRVTEQEWL